MSLQESRVSSTSNLIKSSPDASAGTYPQSGLQGNNIPGCNHNVEKNIGEIQNDESQENDTSNPAAFTITFDEDTKGPKKFGLRDSIRKFAPPKPHTIEKPRPPRSTHSQDCSLNSIESSPGHFSMPRYQSNTQSQSHAKVSDSAKFLIDKMLDYDRASLPPVDLTQSASIQPRTAKVVPDLSDDRSDNGTYVIVPDLESDAARSKIDELFGVVKAAETSLLAESASRESSSFRCTTTNTTQRPDQALDLRGRYSKDRLSGHLKASVMSTSSSPQDNERNSRTSRRSRNTSVDRTSRNTSQQRPKRSSSQASRNSSHRDGSDNDTRSSLSSLQNFTDRPTSQPPSQPSMRFNRTVALRRARLGLGEPVTGSTGVNGRQIDSQVNPSNVSNIGHRTHNQVMKDEDSSATFSRDDGGRYSLRSKGVGYTSRFSPGGHHQTSRFYPQVFGNKHCPPSGSANSRRSQDSDMTGYLMDANHHQKGNKHQGDLTDHGDHGESDNDSTAQRFQYSLNAIDRTSTSSRHTDRMDFGGIQYGNALDSLVVSAISSLSLRISHSICDILMEQARKLSRENEVRQIVEETIPQLMIDSESPRTSLVDRPLVCNDLSKTLKNLRKIEQMVDVIGLVSTQLPNFSRAIEGQQELVRRSELGKSSSSTDNTGRSMIATRRADDSDVSPDMNSTNELSS